jgi:hypothetical protein
MKKPLSRRMLELLWSLGHGRELHFTRGGHFRLLRDGCLETIVYPHTVAGLLDRELIRLDHSTGQRTYRLTEEGKKVAGLLESQKVVNQ